MDVAVLPRPVGDQVAGLRRLVPGGDPPPREIWMGHHRSLRQARRLRAFLDLVVELLGARGAFWRAGLVQAMADLTRRSGKCATA